MTEIKNTLKIQIASVKNFLSELGYTYMEIDKGLSVATLVRRFVDVHGLVWLQLSNYIMVVEHYPIGMVDTDIHLIIFLKNGSLLHGKQKLFIKQSFK